MGFESVSCRPALSPNWTPADCAALHPSQASVSPVSLALSLSSLPTPHGPCYHNRLGAILTHHTSTPSAVALFAAFSIFFAGWALRRRRVRDFRKAYPAMYEKESIEAYEARIGGPTPVAYAEEDLPQAPPRVAQPGQPQPPPSCECLQDGRDSRAT